MTRPTHVVVSSFNVGDGSGRYYLAKLMPNGKRGVEVTGPFGSEEPLNDSDLVILRDGKAERARR